jgi:hypothetical protein
MTEAKAFRTFMRICSLFKNDRLSSNIELTFREALIRTVMTYAWPAWELAAGTYLLKLQPCKTRFFAPLEIFESAHRSAIYTRLSNLSYVYDYIKICASYKLKLYAIMKMNIFAV